MPSARQIDQLGERIRAGVLTDADRRALEEFRASVLPAYQEVVTRIRESLGVDPTGRPEKRPESIIAKLQRGESTLSKMRDIAGCRIVVANRAMQDELVKQVVELFPGSTVVDRRDSPRYGYRAVHVVARAQGRPVEIQVRTRLQDLWANLEESFSDEGVDLKHGVEPPDGKGLLGFMTRAGDVIAWVEERGWDFPTDPELTRSQTVYLQLGLFQGIMASVMHLRASAR